MKKQVWKSMLLLLPILAITLNSCGKKEDDEEDLPEKYNVEGVVINTTGVSVKQASVTILDNSGDVVASATTDTSGAFVMLAVEEGEYEVEISAVGYTDELIDIDVDKLLDLQVLLTGTASISGRILDSQTGSGKSGVIVGLSFDSNVAKAADCDLIDTTDYFGNFSITEAPSGTFRAVIEADSASPRIVDGVELTEETTTTLGEVTSVTLPTEGELRIVLTWGVNPSDLDSHLTGPDDAEGRFHVYYSDEYYVNTSGITEADLDVDDVSSYGPETITIHNFRDGIYRYSVHNYSNDEVSGGQEILDSPARVEVYDASGLVQAFTPPPFAPESGNTWVVCELTSLAGTVTVTEVGRYEQNDDEDVIAK